MQRRRFKQILTFPERLDQEAERLRKEADKLPHGPERDGSFYARLDKPKPLFTSTNGFHRRDCRPRSSP